VRRLGFALAALLSLHTDALAASSPQRFASPDDAVTALISAIRADDRQKVLRILGPAGRPLIWSGDSVADRQAADKFLADYDKSHRLQGGSGKVVLYVGPDDFPFAIPLVPDGDSWEWDAAAGRDEILKRRIGRDELSAIQVCLAYVDAQREYYAQDRKGNGILQYAQHLRSTPGKRDGLYWPTRDGDKPSPLGTLVAQARREGYQRQAAGPVPYHGYFYRILTAQGPDAPGGAYDYVVNGQMIGGFGLVAFPAQYGNSGVMTFIVNHDGVVYEKDLGPNTARIAGEMKVFSPDQTWRKVDPTAGQ